MTAATATMTINDGMAILLAAAPVVAGVGLGLALAALRDWWQRRRQP